MELSVIAPIIGVVPKVHGGGRREYIAECDFMTNYTLPSNQVCSSRDRLIIAPFRTAVIGNPRTAFVYIP
jgi:hypothetical protein